MKQQFQPDQQSAAGASETQTPSAAAKAGKPGVGEYIDFEEVK
ncbi:DUF4834 family protein [Niabella ginsenosidivorans]|nr:DUF4834 family protein [Niabella ginsenosidivorans]